MTVFILLIAVAVIWALFGLWGAYTYNKDLSPEDQALSRSIISKRRSFIIQDGLARHLVWKENHPFLGRLYTYKPQKYLQSNRFNTKKYPY